MLMVENPTFLYQVVAMLLLATVAILVYGLSLTRLFIKVLLVPRERLMAVVYVLCVVGSFAITQRMFDVYVMLVFGVLGFVLREMKYPMAPLVLGHHPRRPRRHQPAARPAAQRRRPVAVLHPADLAALFLLILFTILLSVPAVKRRAASLFAPRDRPNSVDG